MIYVKYVQYINVKVSRFNSLYGCMKRQGNRKIFPEKRLSKFNLSGYVQLKNYTDVKLEVNCKIQMWGGGYFPTQIVGARVFFLSSEGKIFPNRYFIVTVRKIADKEAQKNA